MKYLRFRTLANLTKKQLLIGTGGLVGLAGLFLVLTFFINPSKRFAATVDGVGIKRSLYESELAASRHFYNWSGQDPATYSSLQNDVLEKLIDMQLVENYAREGGIAAGQDEVQERYRQIAQRNSEDQLLAQLSEMYGVDKEKYLEKLRQDILKERVQSNVGMPLTEWLAQQRSELKIERYVR